MPSRFKLLLLATIAMALLLAASCASPSPTATPIPPTPTPVVTPTRLPTPTAPPTTPSSLGRVEIRATDAPDQNVTRIMVTASEVEAHMSGAGEGQWTRLIADPAPFDLIAISGVEHALGAGQIPAGDYTQVRLTIDKIVVTLEGKDVEANVPSDRLRFVTPFGIVEGETTIITMDFDAEKSVVITGSDKVQFRPVVKLIVSRPPSKTPTPTQPATTPAATPTGPAAAATPTAGPTASGTPTPSLSPSPSPTGAPPAATPTQAAAIPFIPHPVEGREDCVQCHSAGFTAPRFPANHEGRGNDTCQVCHKPTGSIGGAPNIPHTLEGRPSCVLCHQEGMTAPAFPADHASRTSNTCIACHQSG